MSRRRLSAGHLLWRHATAGTGASVTVAVVVFVLAGIAVGVPRAIQLLVTDSVQHEVTSLPVTTRDLVGQAFGGPVIGASADPAGSPFEPEVDAVWGSLEDGLTDVRNAMPEVVERAVGEVQYAVTLAPNRAIAERDGAPDTEISLGFDPRLLDHVSVTSGEMPEAMTADVPNDEPTGILLSEIIAERMEWTPGEVRELRTPNGTQPLELTGTFAAHDDDDPYWQHVAASLRPSIEIIGLAPPVVIGVGFAHPASWQHVVPFSAGAQLQAWFPLEADAVTAGNAAAFSQGVREFTRNAHRVGDPTLDDGWFGRYTTVPVFELPFSTRVTNALDDAIASTSATSAVLAMLASGPIGVAVAVLLLGTRLVTDRRNTGLQLAAARGASPGQLRATLAVEGLGIGVPAGVLGAVVGSMLVPGPPQPVTLVLAALVAALPAVLLATTPVVSGMRRVRADLGPRATGPWRWILEVLVLAAAGLSTFLLLRRGLTTAAGTVTVDPLLAAVPLLLALATCVVVMRVYPLPLAAIARWAARRPGLTAFLGAARGVRDPASGLAPILAMVVGVSVAVFSGAMLSTVNAGVEHSARASVGADLLVSSQAITAEQADAIEAIDGVVATAQVYAEVRVTLTHDGARDYLTAIVVDAAQLAAVQQGKPGSIEGLDLLHGQGERVPVIASKAVADLLGGSADASGDAEIDGAAIEVVGAAPTDGPMSDRRAWVIVDRTNAEKLVGTIYSPSRVFVGLDEQASATQVRDDIRSLVQASATVSIPEQVVDELRSNPVVTGLQSALIAALVLVSFLCTVAVVMTLARGAAGRDRLLSMLRTLGLGRRSGTAIVAWELAPMTVVALIAGTALGVALPWIVLAGVDLILFTGGSQQPAVVIDPLLTALLTGGFVLLVLVATVIAVVTARRTDPATALRTIEE
ncbi:ABC transporter permease [Homoserinimonas sp. A447]